MALLSDETEIAMPLRNLLSIVAGVALGVWAYFGVVERLNTTETSLMMMEKEVELNSDFRVRWPRGELGSLPADAEQFMLIKELYKQTEKLQLRVDSMLHNEVNIEALSKAVDKLQRDVEKLKDKQREFANGHK